MDAQTTLSLRHAHEKLRLLLGEDVPVEESGFFWTEESFEESAKRAQEMVLRLRRMIDDARERARKLEQRAAIFIRKIQSIRVAEFILSCIPIFDPHALTTRVRDILGHHACIRIPLFEYGPELSEYRHRIR